MIKVKTVAQKKHDKNKLNKQAHKCAKVLQEFVSELYECDFHVNWMRLELINKMQTANNKYDRMKDQINATHTFESYDKDHNAKHFHNSTHIKEYE